MTCSVMQTGTQSPSMEQLQTAFRQVPGLTALDVSMLGKDTYGLLVKGLEFDRAAAMRSALASQGIETEVAEDAVLTELPPPKQLNKAAFTPEALQIYDLLGRAIPLEWNHIREITWLLWMVSTGRMQQ
jgi:hypothetical protein